MISIIIVVSVLILLYRKGILLKSILYVMAFVVALRILAKIAIVVWAIHHISHMHIH